MHAWKRPLAAPAFVDRWAEPRPAVFTGLTASEQVVLALQHAAGNRAVTQLLQPASALAVQRAAGGAPPASVDPELALGNRLIRDFPDGVAVAFHPSAY